MLEMDSGEEKVEMRKTLVCYERNMKEVCSSAFAI